MSNLRNGSNDFLYNILMMGILFLFFFQLLSDFIESIYFLNLIKVELNENILAILFLLTPLIFLFIKRDLSGKSIMYIGDLLLIFRILQPIFDVQVKMVLSGLGVGMFMIFFPAYLKDLKGFSKEDHQRNGIIMGSGLGLGVLTSIMLRTLGSTVDLSLTFSFQWIGWILAAIAAFLLYKLFFSAKNESQEQGQEGSLLKIIGVIMGMLSILSMIYFAFSSPGVISRWTEGNYLGILAVLGISITIVVLIVILKPEIISKMNTKILVLLNSIFTLFLVVTIVEHQVFFLFISSYPYVAPPTNWLMHVPLYLMLALSPILLIDFILLTRELIKSRPSMRKLGLSFFIGSGFMILIIFSNVFTIAWDYIPLVGDFFRDMIWMVYLIIGVIIALSAFLIRDHTYNFRELKNIGISKKAFLSAICLALLLITIISASIYQMPKDHEKDEDTIKILSYNIQQGADASANKNFEGQFEVIQKENADIIGLEESDTCRISSGNSDVVRYINERLRYYSYFGPKTVTGTFGIALLSRYPIQNAKTFYMTSEGEQTATIEAEITIDDKTFNVYVTHLGNYVNTSVGRSQIIQQEEILERIEGKENVILMGDFNFRPNTEQYEITTEVLEDCWEIADHQQIDSVPASWEDRLPGKRIDHIFVSSGTSVTECRYFGGSVADHPAYSVIIEG